MLKFYINIISIILLCSCSIEVNERKDLSKELAAKNLLKKQIVKTPKFSLLTYSKFEESNDYDRTLNVYIEGDGFAWKRRNQPSVNPTPKNPVSLKLAAIDKSSNVLYIARPCQYIDIESEKNCNSEVWTNARFSDDIVESINKVISYYLSNNKLNRVNIYGYSGGGALAVLVAAQRNDVQFIKTIAANLDHKKLNEMKGLTPLTNSLNAIDFVEKVKNIPQLHIIGEKDKVINAKTIIGYVKTLNSIGGNAKFMIAKKADHGYKYWEKIWVKDSVKDLERSLIESTNNKNIQEEKETPN